MVTPHKVVMLMAIGTSLRSQMDSLVNLSEKNRLVGSGMVEYGFDLFNGSDG